MTYAKRSIGPSILFVIVQSCVTLFLFRNLVGQRRPNGDALALLFRRVESSHRRQLAHLYARNHFAFSGDAVEFSRAPFNLEWAATAFEVALTGKSRIDAVAVFIRENAPALSRLCHGFQIAFGRSRAHDGCSMQHALAVFYIEGPGIDPNQIG